MGFELMPHQVEALLRLKNGSVLVGGVGSGKSITALEYFARIAPETPIRVVTTAKKRDSGEWYKDAMKMSLRCQLDVVSWNAISQYENEVGVNFIFDEQRVVGYGAWTKSFIEITKKNRWLLLTATPADVWMDLVPVFIAHGYFKNKSDFCDQHVQWSWHSRYPKVERYFDQKVLEYYRNRIYVEMPHIKPTTRHEQFIDVGYDRDLEKEIYISRWHIYEDRPIKDAGEMIRLLRKATNSDPDRIIKFVEICSIHPRVIIFYNNNYELDIIRESLTEYDIPFAEWNGHKHDSLPDTDRWVYVVQYQAGSEGWNCTTTDTVVFYSLPYSYRNYEQAKGRIDRLDTEYVDLYYYIFKSNSIIDQAIWKNLQRKKNFQVSAFIKKHWEKQD